MDAKTAKRAELLRTLIDHPRTCDNEREAARLMLGRLLAKAGVIADGPADRRVYGARYDRSLSTAQIAALVRAQIKLARKLAKQTAGGGAVKLADPIGDAPEQIKIRVRSEHFSGGSAINVCIEDEPHGWGWETRADRHGVMRELPTPALQALADGLADLMHVYNFDGGDVTADLFDKNFYGRVFAGGTLQLACA